MSPSLGRAHEHNILLMTDGYKFSHHKQYPVSWLPEHARPNGDDFSPPVLFPPVGSRMGSFILKLARTPGKVTGPIPVTDPMTGKVMTDPITGKVILVTQLVIVTNASTAVVDVEVTENPCDVQYSGSPVAYTGGVNKNNMIVIQLTEIASFNLGFGRKIVNLQFSNVDKSKLKCGSSMNANFEGGYNVSYFTPRAYKDAFKPLDVDGNRAHIVFFGLQYIIKEYLVGEVVTADRIDAADEFIARFMADVRVGLTDYAGGWDYTMFPRGDWEAILTGDYDGTGGFASGAEPGCLPIKIDALPEGSVIQPGVACFKLTNTHPRFYWLPNFLETLLVQVWYPTTVATQAREFRKTIQAYAVLSQRVSDFPGDPGDQEFTAKNITDDKASVHIAQVFDLLDFGYRGVSSHETAMLGSAAYYTAGFEGSDTVAGPRMLLSHYGASGTLGNQSFRDMFDKAHCATSIPASEHSTITSWANMDPETNPVDFEKAEYAAFANMIRQYMPSFAVSLVSDGFNIWNAICNLWPCKTDEYGVVAEPAGHISAGSMYGMIDERTRQGKLTIVRPDSGEAVETLPQMLTLFTAVLPCVWETSVQKIANPFLDGTADHAKYIVLVDNIKKKLKDDGQPIPEGSPFRRFKGQQFRILQGDGVALDTVGDMLASVLANGFCTNTVNFGSGGGLLQKVNRDSLSCAFKCCAMYVGEKVYAIGKDPIAGGKTSYAGNPAVIIENGVFGNRKEPISVDDFKREFNGVRVEGNQLVTVFLNGEVKSDQTFHDVRSRAKIASLDGAISRAFENVNKKLFIFQRATGVHQMALRVAEAALGSKWNRIPGVNDVVNPAVMIEKLKGLYGGRLRDALCALGLEYEEQPHVLLARIKALVCKNEDVALAAIAGGYLVVDEDSKDKPTWCVITL